MRIVVDVMGGDHGCGVVVEGVKMALEGIQVNSRRYFYPSLSTLRYHQSNSAPVAESISSRILCLPLYHDLKKEEIDFIVRILLRVQNN